MYLFVDRQMFIFMHRQSVIYPHEVFYITHIYKEFAYLIINQLRVQKHRKMQHKKNDTLLESVRRSLRRRALNKKNVLRGVFLLNYELQITNYFSHARGVSLVPSGRVGLGRTVTHSGLPTERSCDWYS